MQRILSPATRLAIAVAVVLRLAACGGAAALPADSAPAAGAPVVPRHTLESVPIVAGGTSTGSVTAGFSAPMIDTDRQHRVTWPIEPGDASYALIRWHLDRRSLPPPEAIRTAGLANAFSAALPAPQVGALGLTAQVFPSPIRRGFHILHLGLRGADAGHRDADRPATVFVIMVESSAAAVPRIREATRALAASLQDRDLLGLVAKGPQGRMILEPTRVVAEGREWNIVDRAVDVFTGSAVPDLVAGLQSAYDMAARTAYGRPVRILLFSDGAGLGAPGDELFDDLRRQARAGRPLSVVGFPVAGYDHRLMSRLADAGEGRYAVADHPAAARRLGSRLPGRLAIVARDVAGRIELDSETVSRFRLLGDPTAQPAGSGAFGRSLTAGSRTTALIELQLTGRRGPLGAVRVRYRPAGDAAESDAAGAVKQFELTLPSARSDRENAGGSPAWIAATLAEKLSRSYWVRKVSYGSLLGSFRSLDAGLQTDPRIAELRYLIQQARRLEQRHVRSWNEEPRPAPADSRPIFDQLRILE